MSVEVIRWPTPAEALIVEEGFYKLRGIKHVIGCVDGTHFRIDAPKQREAYINRKGYFSLQMQAICNSEKHFTDVFIGFPGSVHDARVYENSFIYDSLPSKCQGRFLLSDSAYPLSTYCITPFKDNGHLEAWHKNFNKKHSGTRVTIENAYGILRQRFRSLFHIKFRGLKRITQFILGCCVLHKLASNEDLQFLDDPMPQNCDPDDPNDCHANAQTGGRQPVPNDQQLAQE